MRKIRVVALVLGMTMSGFSSFAAAREKLAATEMRINLGLVSSGDSNLKGRVMGILTNYGGRLVREIPQLGGAKFYCSQEQVPYFKPDLFINLSNIC